MTEIFLDMEGTLPRLREWVGKIEADLGDLGRVRHSLGSFEADDDGQPYYRTVYVDVFDAESEVEALEVLRPIVHPLIYGEGESVLRRGTTVWQIPV